MTIEKQNKKRISSSAVILITAAATFLLLAAVIVIFLITGNRKAEPDPGISIVPNISVTFSKLDKSRFHKEKDIISYSDGVKQSKAGIDVSFAQKEIDWNKVKASGVDFAMIRAGYRGYETGRINLDEFFHKNMKGALDSGIETGVYFFSQAVNETEAIEEAEFVLGLIDGYNVTYPVAFDWETVSAGEARTDGISADALNRCAHAFCRTVESRGYRPVIYASLNLLREKFDKYSIDNISDYDLWLAEYKNHPEFPYQFSMWQYTDEGIIDGISYPTDLNIYIE